MTKQQVKKTQNQTPVASQSSHSASGVGSRDELTFLEHIYELRSRLFWVVAALVVTSSIGYYYKDYLVSFIIAPLHGEKLVYLTPGGGFSFIFTVCMYFGALLTIPVIVYHIYRFLQPVLGNTSRRFIILLVLLSGALATAGAVFGYMVAIPGAINFLTTFAGDAVSPNLTAESYLGFVVAYMLGLAALFQLPLLLFMFDHVRPFPPGALLSSQRFVIVGAFIAAALITPTPDIINQLIVAGPIIVVYQLGAIAVYTRRKIRQRRKVAVGDPLRVQEITTLEPSAPITTTPVQAPVALTTVSNLASQAVITAATTPPVRRSVDGFSRKPSRAHIAAPVRIVPVTKQRVAAPIKHPELRSPSTNPAFTGRPLRSTDGFLAS